MFLVRLVLLPLVLVASILWTRSQVWAQQDNIPVSEISALWSLYNATDGANWIWYNPSYPQHFNGSVWEFGPSANPCADHWQGITCYAPMVSNYSYVANLTLTFHGLHGSIPAEIGQLTQLQSLDLAFNRLNGSIPAEVRQLTQLQGLYLYHNKLTSNIPAAVGQLTLLQQLDIHYNLLSGTIPPEIAQLTQLQGLDLHHNKLSGSIPAEIAQLKVLQMLGLNSNELSGSIPAEIGQLSQLQALDLDTNKLSGRIPAEIGQLTQLRVLYLESNQLSGSILADIGQLTQLQVLYLDSNELSGSIPVEIGQLRQLQELDLDTNKLLGSIPAEIGQLMYLQVLDLDSNQFSGSLPTEIGRLLHLEYLNIADNAITGSVVAELFQLANLSALIAGKNCFEGTLPQAVCGATALVSLNLDGLHTAQQCSKRQVPFTYVYGGAQAFHGTIPDCIFQLPLLTSLHLSGNSLTGTIPGNLSADAVLMDLVFSHNSLVGSIPASIQLRAWDTLDLSYNRLDGTLLTSFGEGSLGSSDATTSVYLKNNRLSGHIPNYLRQLLDVDILGSNMFTCGADRSALPENDEDKDRYQCGSNSFVGHLIAALVTVAAFLTMWIAMIRWQCSKGFATAVGFAERWFQEAKLGVMKLPADVDLLGKICATFCNIAVRCAIAIVVCLLPWYAVAHSQFGTYTHAYAWVVSAAFLSGLEPAVAELALYCALMIALVIGGTRLLAKGKEHGYDIGLSNLAGYPQLGISSSGNTPTPQWYEGLLHALFFLTNLTVVLLVNVGFVAASLQADQLALSIAQILYTAFKLLWNMVCTPYLIDIVTAYTGRRRVSSSLVTIHMLLSLLNNVVIPCLVVAVQSSSCFLNVFEASPTVNAEYAVPGCEAFAFVDGNDNIAVKTVCTSQYPVPLSLQFEPHFSYAYQCSSSFITYYSPVFVLMGLTAGVLIPSAKAVSLYCLTRAVPGTRWHRVLSLAVPRILKPATLSAPPSDPSPQPGTPAAILRRLREERIFNGVTAISALSTYLGILLTFGVVFPPLAVIMCATMWSVHWQTRLMLGKFVHDAQAAGAMHLIERLEQDCRSVVSLQTLQRVMFLITCICCCFYALFLFDTLGDARGAADSYWIFLVMALFPVVLYVLNRLLQNQDAAKPAGFQGGSNNLEMAAIVAGPSHQVAEGSHEEAARSAGSGNKFVVAETTRSALHSNNA